MNNDNANDHEIWIRCFTAAIPGILSTESRQSAERPALERIAKLCADVADVLLDEERKRRPAADSGMTPGFSPQP